MNTYAIRNIVGIIGNVISFFLFLSPAPTFFTIIKRKDVEEFSPNPYMATLLNCAMWVFYGLPFVTPHSTLVITINGFGLFIESLYIIIYFIFANKKKRVYVSRLLVGEICFFVVVVGLTFGLLHTPHKRSLVAGILCVVFNILMYGMPLDIMWMVIKTKSVEYMPFYLSLAGFLNGCIWVVYALLRFDLFILISNGTGSVLGAIQLILYGCFYRSTPKRDDKNNPPAEVELPTTTDGRIRPSV